MGSIPPETVLCVKCDATLFRSDKRPKHVHYYHNEGRSGRLDVIFLGDTPGKNKTFSSDVYNWMQATMYFCYNENGNWKESENYCNYVRCEDCTEIIGRMVVCTNVKDGEYARFELRLSEGKVKVDIDSSSDEGGAPTLATES